MNQLVQCPACGYKNDATRVFCHNCGVRLPRTKQEIEKKVAQNRQATEEAKKVLREGVRKVKKRSAKDALASVVHTLITTGFYAAVVAAIILALRLPPDSPPPGTPDSRLVEAGNRQIANAAKPGFKGNIATSQEQINDYLATEVILVSRPGVTLLNAEAHRLFVALEQGDFVLGLEYSLAGMPLVVATSFGITGSPGAFSLKVRGGSIGRLPLHPIIFERVFKWYEPAAEALDSQLQILSKAESIEITPGEIKVTWDNPPPPGPTGPPRSPDLPPAALPVSPSRLR